MVVNGEYIYTGERIVPDITVKMGNLTLVKDTDYTVSGGGIDAGPASVTIQGANGYKGTREVPFVIKKAASEAEVPEGPFVFTYGQKCPTDGR